MGGVEEIVIRNCGVAVEGRVGGVFKLYFIVIHYHYSKALFLCRSPPSHYLMQGFVLISFHFHLFILVRQLCISSVPNSPEKSGIFHKSIILIYGLC